MSATSTNFLNSKMRRIYQSTRGKFFSKDGDNKYYGVKAMYRTVGRTGARKKILEKSNVNVPAPLQRAVIAGRKARSNKGVKRGMRNLTEGKARAMIWNGKMPGVRKVRKNKGVKRVA